jgi:hypothetical protein
MAFCNSCGSGLEAGAKFCPKCGTPAPAAAAGTVAPATTPVAPVAPAQSSSSALKIVLIVVAVIFGIGILGAGALGFVAWRIAHHSHVSRDGEVKVETPFGTLESTEDPNQAARNVGVALYPGATVEKGGSANMTIGSLHTATVQLETSDSPATVSDFYKTKFPGANVMSSQGDRFSLMIGDKNNMTTISIEPREGLTRITIAKVTKPGSSD